MKLYQKTLGKLKYIGIGKLLKRPQKHSQQKLDRYYYINKDASTLQRNTQQSKKKNSLQNKGKYL